MIADQSLNSFKHFYSLKVLYTYTMYFNNIHLLPHPTNLYLSPVFMASIYLFTLNNLLNPISAVHTPTCV